MKKNERNINKNEIEKFFDLATEMAESLLFNCSRAIIDGLRKPYDPVSLIYNEENLKRGKHNYIKSINLPSFFMETSALEYLEQLRQYYNEKNKKSYIIILPIKSVSNEETNKDLNISPLVIDGFTTNEGNIEDAEPALTFYFDTNAYISDNQKYVLTRRR